MAYSPDGGMPYFKYVRDIGVHAVDRDMGSCIYATPWCQRYCYALKFYRGCFPAMATFDDKLKASWSLLNDTTFTKWLKGEKKPVTRFRFCTRGEPFVNEDDVAKIREIVEAHPEIEFWIPTRAWRDKTMRGKIPASLAHLKNAHVQASIDPSTRKIDVAWLKRNKWPIMSVARTDTPPTITKCPKTWQKIKGHCAVCDKGCFSGADVSLKQH